MSNLGVLAPREEDIRMMLAANVHQGTRNLNASMETYIWKRRPDGVHIINLEKTWEKMILAARVIVTIENPGDVCVISGRPYGQRAVIKFSQHTGATQLPGRFTPGTFTNQIQKLFLEPRLLILTDPRTDSQPLKESSYVNLPTIAFCDTDNELQFVDVAIPANNKGRHSIGLMYWLLAREIRRMRGHLHRESAWEVSVDLFFYRDPEEIERQQQEQAERNADQAQQMLGYGDIDEAPKKEEDQWAQPQQTAGGGADEWGNPAAAPAQQAPAVDQQQAFAQPPVQQDEWAAPQQTQGFAPQQGYQQQAYQQAPTDDWGAPAPANNTFAAPQQQPW